MKQCAVSTEKTNVIHIGVDVSKEKLDVYVPALKEGQRPTTLDIDNDVKGFRKLREIARKAEAVICVEPTGGYELELIASMQKHGVRIAYADALRVRQFARAEGNLSKNDTIDAALISRFADKIGVRLIDEKEASVIELKRRTKLRESIIEMRKALICRLETEVDAELRRMIDKELRHQEKVVAKLEAMCRGIVRENERMNALHGRFMQVGGVGESTSFAVLAGLPEIGRLPDEKLNRLVGIAPEEKQSGTREWKRQIWGGRKDVRNALYMGTFAALNWNSILGAYYRKKRSEGYVHKQAMIPAMRKLLSLLNRIARDPSFVPAPEPESTRRNFRGGRKRKAA